MRILRRGTRLASAARLRRAAMFAWASIAAILGKPPRRMTSATPRRRSGRTNVSGDPLHTPRARNGRAPDVFRRGGWVPMREYSDDEDVDFSIVRPGSVVG